MDNLNITNTPLLMELKLHVGKPVIHGLTRYRLESTITDFAPTLLMVA